MSDEPKNALDVGMIRTALEIWQECTGTLYDNHSFSGVTWDKLEISDQNLVDIISHFLNKDSSKLKTQE